MFSFKLEKSSVNTKRYLFDSVYSQTRLSSHYFWQLILSTVIATLGLLTDNTVVVIGAMLISPLFWPVMGIALGIITSRKHILKDSFISLAVSFLAVMFFSSLIAVITPVSELPREVTSRVNPTIIDLFIALATSVIGVLALYYPSISASTAGVAISISLLPPLCVAGIGLASLSGHIMGRSLLLFGTNTGAIVFIGVVVLYLLNIKPVKVEEEKRFKFGVLFSGLFMILLSIPLSIYLKDSLDQKKLSLEIEKIIRTDIKEVSSSGKVERVNIDFLSLGKSTPLNIDAVIYLPENVYMTQLQKEDLINKISTLTNSDVSLKFNVVSTLSLQTEEDQEKSLLRRNIREMINEELATEDKDIVIDSIDIAFPSSRVEPDKYHAKIVIMLKQFGRIPLSTQHLQDLKKFIETKLNITVDIEVEFIPVSRLFEDSLEAGAYEKINEGFKQILGEISEAVYVEDLSVRDAYAYVKIYTPSNVYISDQDKILMEELVQNVLGADMMLNLQIIRYELK